MKGRELADEGALPLVQMTAIVDVLCLVLRQNHVHLQALALVQDRGLGQVHDQDLAQDHDRLGLVRDPNPALNRVHVPIRVLNRAQNPDPNHVQLADPLVLRDHHTRRDLGLDRNPVRVHDRPLALNLDPVLKHRNPLLIRIDEMYFKSCLQTLTNITSLFLTEN